MPQDAAALWGFIGELTEADRLALLAHCVALSVDAVRQDAHSDEPGVPELAQAVALDMRADWQPTAASYFSRVSRDRILEAVREGVSPEAADNLAKLKKAALADAAERRLQDKGWLPPILRLAAPLATHDA